MLFRTARARLIADAPAAEMTCRNCGNTSEMRLYSVKHGPGIGIPILMFFSDRFVFSAKKKGYACPICDAMVEV